MEVKVANLAANRVTYHEINKIPYQFNLGYGWRTAPVVNVSFILLESGLFGTVRLIPSINTLPDSKHLYN